MLMVDDDDRRMFVCTDAYGNKCTAVFSAHSLTAVCEWGEIDRALALDVGEDMPCGSWTLRRVADDHQ
jgi:hypothetical protein